MIGTGMSQSPQIVGFSLKAQSSSSVRTCEPFPSTVRNQVGNNGGPDCSPEPVRTQIKSLNASIPLPPLSVIDTESTPPTKTVFKWLVNCTPTTRQPIAVNRRQVNGDCVPLVQFRVLWMCIRLEASHADRRRRFPK